jgi:hypothetical protein
MGLRLLSFLGFSLDLGLQCQVWGKLLRLLNITAPSLKRRAKVGRLLTKATRKYVLRGPIFVRDKPVGDAPKAPKNQLQSCS